MARPGGICGIGMDFGLFIEGFRWREGVGFLSCGEGLGFEWLVCICVFFFIFLDTWHGLLLAVDEFLDRWIC